MLKLMWIDEHPVWIPVTEQEDAEFAMFAEAVRNIPESKPVVHHFGYCADERDAEPGRHAKAEFSPETSGYDYLYAELCNERNAEKARVRDRRKADRKHPENKAERKKNEMRKIHRLYGCVWEDGFGWSWEYKSGAKKVPEKEAEIFRNLKERSAEKVDLADWELESAEIAEDEMIARFNAELEEFDRKWREEAEAEQRKMREYRKLCDLHEWLKYA